MRGSNDDESGAISDYTDGTPEQDAISRALSTVDGVLAFGRKLHGLGGGGGEEGGMIDVAGRMPTRPPGQSDTGVPPLQPEPGRLPPTSNPFGKRADNGVRSFQIPPRPAGQSDTGIPPLQPDPGRLPPTSNPFGKRAEADEDEGGTGAITEDEDIA